MATRIARRAGFATAIAVALALVVVLVARTPASASASIDPATSGSGVDRLQIYCTEKSARAEMTEIAGVGMIVGLALPKSIRLPNYSGMTIFVFRNEMVDAPGGIGVTIEPVTTSCLHLNGGMRAGDNDPIEETRNVTWHVKAK